MLLEKREISPIFEKKKLNKFENIGMTQMLTFWNKETRGLWRKKFLVNSLIKQKDYSTLFELINNDYNFSKSQYVKINKSLNDALIDRHYRDKLGIIQTLDKYKIEINNEKYYYLLISNVFNEALNGKNKNNIYNVSEEERELCVKVVALLEDVDFKKGLHEFIIKDMEIRPQDFGGGLNWAMNRNVYYEFSKNIHLFNGMSKGQFKRIIKSGIAGEGVVDYFQSLANKADLDIQLLAQLGVNTKSIVEKAQKSLLLKEDSLTPEMKELVDKISQEIEKIQKNDSELLLNDKEELHKLIDEILPNVIGKYLSIDEEYRTTLKNVEGKYPSQLLLESLDNIYVQVNEINKSINEDKVSKLSIDNRKLKFVKKM